MAMTKRELIQFMDELVELASEENKTRAILVKEKFINDFEKNYEYEKEVQTEITELPQYYIAAMPDLIQEEIARLSLEKRKTPVIIIDEANYINNTILNDLKILFNFEMDSRDRAAILLAGLPKLNSTLRLAIHEPLYQRLVMNYNLEGLSKEEGRSYIHEKLKGSGCNQTVFHESAVEAILNAADGTPRIINKLCNACLLIGDSNKSEIITAETAMQAINDCELG